MLKAPDLPSASGPGEIVALELQNNTGSAQKPGEVTFGHVFRQGDLDAGKHLTAVIGGHEVPVQMDVKATHPDGSVRHALLTIDQPGLDAGEKATAMLKTAGAGPSGATIKPADILAKGYDVDINLDLKGANGATTHFKIDAAAELAKAAADGTLKTWMSGPLASEYRVVKAVNDHLNVTLDIRAFKDGSVRTDVIMGVESSYKPGLQSFYNYDIEVRDHNSVVYAKDDIAHYRNSRWHKEVWSGGEPDVHVAQDVDYMKSTGAVVGIDSSMGVTPGSVALPSSAKTGPMANAMISKDMSQVGGRGDLGIMPIWNARYLASQNEQAEKTMLANADAAGSIPWHYRDEATGDYLRIDQHPNLWMDGRTNWPQFGDDGLTNGFPDGKAAGWAFDTAHQPALSYLPYLVTGSQYYLDELMAQTDLQRRVLRAALPGPGTGLHRLRSGAQPRLDVARHERRGLYHARRSRDEGLFRKAARQQSRRAGPALCHQRAGRQVRRVRRLPAPQHLGGRRHAGLAVGFRGAGARHHGPARQCAGREDAGLDGQFHVRPVHPR